jgi:hypothetical protein
MTIGKPETAAAVDRLDYGHKDAQNMLRGI